MDRELDVFRPAGLVLLLLLGACALLPSVALAGPLEASPSSISFTKEIVGKTSGSQTVVFTNNGLPGDESIEVVVISGDSADFEIVSDGCLDETLEEGAFCEVAVAFTPHEGGVRQADLELKAEGMPVILVPLEGIGQTQRLTVPETESFPLTSTGAWSTQPVLLDNESETAVSVTDVKIEGTDPSDFSFEGGNCTGTLAPDQSCELKVRFTPGAAGDRSARIKVVSDGSPGEQFVDLEGEGTDPELAFEPESFNFGLSEVHAGGAEGTLTLRNAGDASVQVNLLNPVGPDHEEFWIPSTDCFGISLEPDQTCTVQVRFNANQEGTFSAALRAEAGGLGFEAQLTARAERPVVTPSPALLDFGEATVGTGTVRTLTLSNDGNLPVGFFIAIVSGGDVGSFRIVEETCTGRRFEPGESCAVQIRFDPATAGAKHATASFFGNGEGPLQVPLEGEGAAPQLTLSPSEADFGPVAAGAAGPTRTFQLRNESAGPVAVDSAGLGGADLGEFAIRSDTCTEAELAPTEACTVTIRFDPETEGAKSARLRIRTGSGTTSASLTGNGVVDSAVATPTDMIAAAGRVAFALRRSPGGAGRRVAIGRARCESSLPCVVRLSGRASGRLSDTHRRRTAIPLTAATVRIPAGSSKPLSTLLPAELRGAIGARRLVVSLSWRTGEEHGRVGRGFSLR